MKETMGQWNYDTIKMVKQRKQSKNNETMYLYDAINSTIENEKQSLSMRTMVHSNNQNGKTPCKFTEFPLFDPEENDFHEILLLTPKPHIKQHSFISKP